METEPTSANPTLVHKGPTGASTQAASSPTNTARFDAVTATSNQKPHQKKVRSRGLWRWVAATFLIVLGAASIPLSVLAGWIKDDVLNTDHFVATYGRLADDPEFQRFIATQVTEVAADQIEEALPTGGIGALTSGLSDVLGALPVPSEWADKVEGIPEDIDQGITNLVYDATTSFVASDAFKPVWEGSLREIHSQLVQTMQGTRPLSDPEANATFLTLSTGPLIETLKAHLQAEGAWWAQFLPVVEQDVNVLEVTNVSSLQTSNKLFTAGPAVFAALAIVLLLSGVLLAPSRLFAVALAGIASAAATALTWQSLQGWGRSHLYTLAGDKRLPLSTNLWEVTTGSLLPTISTVIWASLATALVGLGAAVIFHFRAAQWAS